MSQACRRASKNFEYSSVILKWVCYNLVPELSMDTSQHSNIVLTNVVILNHNIRIGDRWWWKYNYYFYTSKTILLLACRILKDWVTHPLLLTSSEVSAVYGTVAALVSSSCIHTFVQICRKLLPDMFVSLSSWSVTTKNTGQLLVMWFSAFSFIPELFKDIAWCLAKRIWTMPTKVLAFCGWLDALCVCGGVHVMIIFGICFQKHSWDCFNLCCASLCNFWIINYVLFLCLYAGV